MRNAMSMDEIVEFCKNMEKGEQNKLICTRKIEDHEIVDLQKVVQSNLQTNGSRGTFSATSDGTNGVKVKVI